MIVGRRGAAALLACLGAGVALSACSNGSGSASHSSTTRSTDTITIQNFAFHPNDDTVSPGEELTVRNQDAVTHTLTALSGAFNTGDVSPGRSKTFTAPERAGSYAYHCLIHQFMTGTLVVK